MIHDVQADGLGRLTVVDPDIRIVTGVAVVLGVTRSRHWWDETELDLLSCDRDSVTVTRGPLPRPTRRFVADRHRRDAISVGRERTAFDEALVGIEIEPLRKERTFGLSCCYFDGGFDRFIPFVFDGERRLGSVETGVSAALGDEL